jgi:hypothetical protein
MSDTPYPGLDLREQTARIDNLREEALKFAAEQHKLTAEMLKLERDRAVIPWQVVATLLAAGAALFAAGAGFIKLIGS